MSALLQTTPLWLFGFWLLLWPQSASRCFAALHRAVYGGEREMPEAMVIRISGGLCLLGTWASGLTTG